MRILYLAGNKVSLSYLTNNSHYMRPPSDYNNGKLNTMINASTKAIKMTTLTLLCPEATSRT